MKKLFLIAVTVIMAAAIMLVGYGAFLNYKSEKVIDLRMANRVLRLDGVKAEERVLLPVWELDSMRLSAENMTDAISRLEGTIEEVFVRQNDHVSKGQAICRIANEDIPIKLAQIDVNIAKAEAVLIRYEHSYERYKRLIDYGAVSQEQYEEALTNYKAAAEEVKQLQLERRQYELQEERLVVTAPLEGEVLMLYKKQGSFLQAGTSVALIGDFSTLQFTEVVTDDELRRLEPLDVPGELAFSKRELDKIYATGYNEGNKGAQQRFLARIVSVEPPPEIEAAMRTIRWSVDNSSGLLEPKRYQDVKIFAIKERKNLAIPKSALLENRHDAVYVWHPSDGKLELRKIATGAADGNYVEVFAGLQPGEIVIVSGKEGLSKGMKAEVNVKGGAADGQ